MAHLGAKFAIKAPLEALLGALGRHLGSKMLPRRPPKGSQTPPDPPRPAFSYIFHQNLFLNGPKIDENGGLGESGNFWGALGVHLGAKMAPKSAKKSLKRGLGGQPGAKMGQLGSKMGSQIHPKSIKNRFNNCLVF